jgi:hypothetical protein
MRFLEKAGNLMNGKGKSHAACCSEASFPLAISEERK